MFVEVARHCSALRIFVNGSFVTAKLEPGDVDVVIWLGDRFRELLLAGDSRALLLKQIFLTRQPEEAFPVTDQEQWDEWIEFFSLLKKDRRKRKGLIEVQLND
jgi:hypothetical protein